MKPTYCLVVLILLLGILSCNKESNETTTTLEGTVYDYITKKPFSGVLVRLVGVDVYGQAQQKSFADSCTTDSMGKYKLSLTAPNLDVVLGKINFPGYFAWQTDVYTYELKAGGNYKREITLYKKNAYVKFKVTNNKGKGVFFDSSFWSDAFPSQGIYLPSYLDSGITYMDKRDKIDVAGNTNIYICWDFKKFYPSNGDYPNLDSIIVHPGDTGVYEIKF